MHKLRERDRLQTTFEARRSFTGSNIMSKSENHVAAGLNDKYESLIGSFKDFGNIGAILPNSAAVCDFSDGYL